MIVIMVLSAVGANVQADPYVTGTYKQIAEGYQLSFVVHNTMPCEYITSWSVSTIDATDLQAPEGWRVSLLTRDVSWSVNEFKYAVQPFINLGGFNFVASHAPTSYMWFIWSTTGGSTGTVTLTQIPEPSSILALFGGLVTVGGFALSRRE